MAVTAVPSICAPSRSLPSTLPAAQCCGPLQHSCPGATSAVNPNLTRSRSCRLRSRVSSRRSTFSAPLQAKQRRAIENNVRAESATTASGETRAEGSAAEDSTRSGETPYRPVVILPGLGNNSGDYAVLEQDLRARGLATAVARMSRPDWLRNAAGLLDGNYWRGTLKPRPVLDWYLERTADAIKEAKGAAPAGRQVSLVAHSAGGWLARLYMAEFGHADVALLVTLGSPHLPPPRGAPGVVDQTRGLLYHIEEVCPGAYHAPHVKYVCVAGRYLKGSPLFGKASEIVAEGVGAVAGTGVGTVASPLAASVAAAADGPPPGAEAAAAAVAPDGSVREVAPTLQTRIVGQGYKQVCGKATVWGDGVVPEEAAHLEGALNVSLDGVYHSPVGASEAGRPWYGTAGVLDKWAHHLLE